VAISPASTSGSCWLVARVTSGVQPLTGRGVGAGGSGPWPGVVIVKVGGAVKQTK